MLCLPIRICQLSAMLSKQFVRRGKAQSGFASWQTRCRGCQHSQDRASAPCQAQSPDSCRFLRASRTGMRMAACTLSLRVDLVVLLAGLWWRWWRLDRAAATAWSTLVTASMMPVVRVAMYNRARTCKPQELACQLSALVQPYIRWKPV